MAHYASAPGDRVASRISDAVAWLYLDKFGKGPLHTETFFRVLAAISGFDAVHDLASEVFVLAPE